MKKKSKVKDGIVIPGLFILILIIIHLFSVDGCYGIIPRYSIGLKGIFLAPLFHANWEHLFNNAYPIMILGFMIINFYNKIAYILFILGWLLTGSLVWLIGDLGFLLSDNHIGCHIGASGIVYMMASFVFFSGIFRRSLPLIAASLVVVFLYGGMIWGIFPEDVIVYSKDQSNISWESHLAGGVVGLFLARQWRKLGPQRKIYSWSSKNYSDPKDDELWSIYQNEFPETEKEEDSKATKFKDLF